MEVCVLASGSSGNSTLLQSRETAVLIDAGISLRRLKKNLSSAGKDFSEIDAILVTHEHADHIKALPKILDVPVYMNQETCNAAGYRIRPEIFDNDFNIGDLRISPVPISHDAANPVGFTIKDKRSTFASLTDLGKADDNVKKAVAEADCLVLEANHDIDMLLNGRYPYILKQRILGEQGHLSNIDAGILVRDSAKQSLKAVFLAHLSENNNTPELALDTFSKLAGQNKSLNMRKIVAERYEPCEIMRF